MLVTEYAVIKPEIHNTFVTFMRTHQHRVYSQALRLLADQRQAEDVVQEVFLKAHQQGVSLWQDQRAPGWLKTVTRNHCFNHLTRYRKRYQLFSEQHNEAQDELDAPLFEDLIEDRSDNNPQNHWEQADQSKRLQQAILTLPIHQRVPIVMYHFDDLSYEQIAQELNIAMAKVKTDIHRGRIKLKILLEKNLSEQPL